MSNLDLPPAAEATDDLGSCGVLLTERLRFLVALRPGLQQPAAG